MREAQPIDLPRLAAARLELHYAAQLVAAVGAAWLPGGSEAAQLRWDLSGELRGPTVPGEAPWHAALHLESLSVVLVGQHARRVVSLEGLSCAEALAHLQDLLDDSLGPGQPRLAWPAHRLPEHPLAAGAPFEAVDLEAVAAWVGWFDHAAELLEDLRAHWPGDAGAVGVCPERLEQSLVLGLGEGRSVRVGLSAGDAHYPEPYWFVAPQPAPGAAADLPPCGGDGHWHTAGFLAAVLPAHDLHGYPEGQVRAFIAAAIPAAEALAGS